MDEMTKLEPIIKISGLTKVYGEKRAGDNLYLTVGKGEVFGLLGPNGAGKTTTVLMLLGLTEPTEGFAWIDGHDCIREPIAVKRIVGYLPDNVGSVSYTHLAEMVSEATREYISAHEEKLPLISTACPSVVRLIRVRFPNLIPHMLPLKMCIRDRPSGNQQRFW